MGRAFTVHELKRPTNKIATAHEHFFCRYERIFSSFFFEDPNRERGHAERGEARR